MSDKDYFKLFMETGKIEYYLEYKKLSRLEEKHDKKGDGNSSK